MGHLRVKGLFFAAAVVSVVWIGCGADGSASTDYGDELDATTSDDGTSSTHPTTGQDGGVVFLDAGLGGGEDTDGSVEQSDGGTGGGGSTILSCTDPNDPGGTEATATALTNTDDCDGDGSSIKGVIAGTGDIDMYKLAAADTFGCEINPTTTTPSSDIEYCMFIKCENGSMSFTGCETSTEAVSESGLPGCCVTTPGSMTLDYGCSGTTNDSVDVFLRVKGLKDACIPYSATYHF